MTGGDADMGDLEFVAYLRDTLAPDLEASGRIETAADFRSAAERIERNVCESIGAECPRCGYAEADEITGAEPTTAQLTVVVCKKTRWPVGLCGCGACDGLRGGVADRSGGR